MRKIMIIILILSFYKGKGDKQENDDQGYLYLMDRYIKLNDVFVF